MALVGKNRPSIAKNMRGVGGGGGKNSAVVAFGRRWSEIGDKPAKEPRTNGRRGREAGVNKGRL